MDIEELIKNNKTFAATIREYGYPKTAKIIILNNQYLLGQKGKIERLQRKLERYEEAWSAMHDA